MSDTEDASLLPWHALDAEEALTNMIHRARISAENKGFASALGGITISRTGAGDGCFPAACHT